MTGNLEQFLQYHGVHVYVCIVRLTLDRSGELHGLIQSLVRSLQPVLLIGLLLSGKRCVSSVLCSVL